MTLRQLRVRIRALPKDSLLQRILRHELEAEAERHAERQQLQDIDDVLAMVRPPT